jgi:hypothetical protein
MPGSAARGRRSQAKGAFRMVGRALFVVASRGASSQKNNYGNGEDESLKFNTKSSKVPRPAGLRCENRFGYRTPKPAPAAVYKK